MNHTLGELFQEIISFLDQREIEYYLIRNYEGYPDQFTGDIDFYIDLKKFSKHQAEFLALLTESGWLAFHTVKRPWVVSYQAVSGSENIGRDIIVLEFFNKFTWLTFEYIDFHSVRKYARRFRSMSVLDQRLGYLVSMMHYLLWAGFIPDKYLVRFNNSLNEADVASQFKLFLGKYISSVVLQIQTSILNAHEPRWVEVDDIPEKIVIVPPSLRLKLLIAVVMKSAARNVVQTIFSMSKIAAISIIDRVVIRGRIFYFPASGNRLTEIVHALKKYHILKNKDTKSFRVREMSIFGSLFFIGKIYWVISRGGMCVLQPINDNGWAHRAIRAIFSRYILDSSTFLNHDGTPDLRILANQLLKSK